MSNRSRGAPCVSGAEEEETWEATEKDRRLAVEDSEEDAEAEVEEEEEMRVRGAVATKAGDDERMAEFIGSEDVVTEVRRRRWKARRRGAGGRRCRADRSAEIRYDEIL